MARIENSRISADALGGLLDLIADGTINNKIAKVVFAAMWETGKSASAIVEEQGLRQVTDMDVILAAVDEVLADHPALVAAYRARLGAAGCC